MITKKGYVGVAPKMAQVSNTIAIVQGGQVTFDLQNSTKRLGAFRLVREYYVHSIMNGEGVLLPGITKSVFRLHVKVLD